MNLTEAILKRRSVRAFAEQPVPEPMVARLLEAAIHAPSASNRQPWRFMVLRDPAIRSQLAAAVREEIPAVLADVRPGFALEVQAYCRNFLHLEQAPVLILALARSEATLAGLFRENTPGQARMQALELSGTTMSVAMAVQNLLLSATEQGLGSCVLTGPLIARNAWERLLAVPDGWSILCLVCVGYPAGTPAPIARKRVDQVLIRPQQGDAHGV